MDKNYKNKLKIWSIYFLIIVLTIFIHEIGHSIPAWFNGYKSVPTLTKNYSPDMPVKIQNIVSLGGVSVTVIILILGIILYGIKKYNFKENIFAGVLVMPSIYTLRFILMGRGHDDAEFQEAQAALGLSYSGHALDWIFLILVIIAIILWYIKAKPNPKILSIIFTGSILTLIFVIILQIVNNKIFDPIFLK